MSIPPELVILVALVAGTLASCLVVLLLGIGLGNWIGSVLEGLI